MSIDEARVVVSGEKGPAGGRLAAVTYVFAPLAHLATSTVVGVEILPRLRGGGVPPEMARAMAGPGRTALDAEVATAGVRFSARTGLRAPLHVNLLADTVADHPALLDDLHTAVWETQRQPRDVVIEIVPPIADPDPEAIVAGALRLRERGYRLCVDEVGVHDHPLGLIARLEPDLVKLHPEIVSGLRDDPACQVVADAVRRLCQRVGALYVADGIGTPADLEATHRQEITIGEGPLLGEPSARPRTQVALPARIAPAAAPIAPTPAQAPETVGKFANPGILMPAASTGDKVRDTFRASPGALSVVLVDHGLRPVGMLDRNRFMLEVSGQFGHALHANRPAKDLADPPRILRTDAPPRAALTLIGESEDDGRTYDDIVIVDPAGRYLGVARVADLLRGIAETNYDRALALHPVTGLPGLPVLTEAVEDRLAGGYAFAAAALSADIATAVRTGGYRAAGEALRVLGHALAEAVERFPHTVAVHGVGETIHLLTVPDRAAALERAVHEGLSRRPTAPAVRIAWLGPDRLSGLTAKHVAAELASLADLPPGALPHPRRGS